MTIKTGSTTYLDAAIADALREGEITSLVRKLTELRIRLRTLHGVPDDRIDIEVERVLARVARRRGQH